MPSPCAPTELDGKVARRTLLPGRYIPVNSLREACLVEQGAAVQVVFVAGGLTISATAVTLEPGAAGDLRQGPQHRQRQGVLRHRHGRRLDQGRRHMILPRAPACGLRGAGAACGVRPPI